MNINHHTRQTPPGSREKAKWSTRLYESYDLAQLADEWRRFSHLGITRKVSKGTVVLYSGDASNKLIFIEKGEIRVIRSLLEGKEKILFCMHEGMVVCEVPFFDLLPSMSNVVAAEDSVLCYFERKVVMEKIFPDNPRIIMSLFQTMASKIRLLCNQSVEISTSELATRICRFILMRAGNADSAAQANGRSIVPSLNQQELSSLLGVHRVTLNKTLRDLENQGIIGPYSKKELYILDVARLRAIANLQ